MLARMFQASMTPRRAFLKSATLGAAIPLALMQGRAQAVAAPTWHTAVGLNGFQSGTYKYRKVYPIWEVLDFAARTGFDGIELVSDWPMGGYPGAGEQERIRALRRLYDGFGLRIFSIQLGADGAFAADAAVRRNWLERFAERVRLAQQLGCACVGLWPYGALGEQSIDAALDHLAHSFHEAGGIAADHGILAAFEIEPPFVFNTAEHLLRIHRGADHPNLKVIYDPSHFDLMNGSTGRPHELLERVGVSNIGYLHLTDTDGTLRDGGTSKHLACGDGHANISTSLQVLRAGGFSGWMMIDAWEIPDPYDACRKGYRMIAGARL
jgi:sugar phosphate isomerase/epimerase